ncbi:MAG: glycosyltransferase, partial [Pirellulales bacterium]
FDVSPDLAECDTLLVDGKFFQNTESFSCDQKGLLLEAWKEKCALGYFDLSDSTVITDPEVFPYVTRYFKNQLPADKSLLGRALYGNRIFTDHYHNRFRVEDGAAESHSPILDVEAIRKIRLGWNAGLGNYALFGPKLTTLVRSFTGQVIFAPGPLYRESHLPRAIDVNCRMATNYSRATVAFQRLGVRDLLRDVAQTGRVSKFQYAHELRHSKVVVSPFGWGEINQKDFEAMIAGAALLKPDLSHLQTWPNYFIEGATYIAHRWDLSDLREKLDLLLENDNLRIRIAKAGQESYRSAAVTGAGLAEFAERVCGITRDLVATAASGNAENVG